MYRKKRRKISVPGKTLVVKSSLELLQALLEGVKGSTEFLAAALVSGVVICRVNSESKRCLEIEIGISSQSISRKVVGLYKIDILSALFRLKPLAYRPRRRFLTAATAEGCFEISTKPERARVSISLR